MTQTREHTYSVGDRVVRFVDDELGTVQAVDAAGQITAVTMDNGRDRDVTYERFSPVVAPYVGMPCSILLYTDTCPAIVVRVNKKSITVARVPEKEGTTKHTAQCECADCPGPNGNPWPITETEGDLQGEQGAPERFRMVREGRYRNGSVGVMLGRSVRRVDYRE